jgi:Fe-S oxidoreductase
MLLWANKVYEAPRDLIAKLDVELVEMKRSKANGLCCGAGGAQCLKMQNLETRKSILKELKRH